MTTQEVYELTTKGGATDFATVVSICRQAGQFCLVGGLAVNCYVEPVFTLDADFVITAGQMEVVRRALEASGFSIEFFPHSMNARAPQSELRIQFTIDPRYQAFPANAQEREVLGVRLPVAALEDLVQGKLWAYSDLGRRLTKRKKDELDLLRLAEKFPYLKELYPEELRKQLS